MKRTRLKNKLLKNRNDYNKKEFSKQRNYCVSVVRKSKKLHYSNLDEKKITDDKTFWKTIKPFLSNKIVSREKVTLIEEDEILESDINTAQILNTFFFNNINDPVIKSSVKYRNHPSILKIGEVCNRKKCSFFFFWHADKEEILSLDSTKVSQYADIPTKVIKDNADIFSDFLLSGLIIQSQLPSFHRALNKQL